MGIWTYTKDGRTLGLCNEDINQASASTCTYQTNVFVWIFLSTFLIFVILDVLPISAYISSSGTRCSHLRIFMVQFLLCLVVSFVVADVGLDLARTSIRMNNPIWHVAWAMPFVLSLLSKLVFNVWRLGPWHSCNTLWPASTALTLKIIFKCGFIEFVLN